MRKFSPQYSSYKTCEYNNILYFKMILLVEFVDNLPQFLRNIRDPGSRGSRVFACLPDSEESRQANINRNKTRILTFFIMRPDKKSYTPNKDIQVKLVLHVRTQCCHYNGVRDHS